MFVGVDAGGSHIELGVALGAGRPPVIRLRGPGIQLAQGVDYAAELILGLLEQALDQLETPAEPTPSRPLLQAWVVGAAGAGREPVRAELQAALADPRLPAARVVTDGELALASAFVDEPGILIGAGTGSYALARGADGSLLRVGGWGPVLSDEGSGFWLATRALRRAARELDGRKPVGRLSAEVLRATGCADLDALVTWSLTASRPAVAGLAQRVVELAQAGEPAAVDLVDAAVDMLLALARALSRQLGVRPAPVALAGGLLTPSSGVRTALIRRLSASDWAHPVEPVVDPVLGALRLATGA